MAKRTPARILASTDAVRAALAADEVDHWRDDGEHVLRGRDQPTQVSTPST